MQLLLKLLPEMGLREENLYILLFPHFTLLPGPSLIKTAGNRLSALFAIQNKAGEAQTMGMRANRPGIGINIFHPLYNKKVSQYVRKS